MSPVLTLMRRGSTWANIVPWGSHILSKRAAVGHCGVQAEGKDLPCGIPGEAGAAGGAAAALAAALSAAASWCWTAASSASLARSAAPAWSSSARSLAASSSAARELDAAASWCCEAAACNSLHDNMLMLSRPHCDAALWYFLLLTNTPQGAQTLSVAGPRREPMTVL